MSVCTASMMWPMCSAPLAYGSALVTRILRGMKTAGPERAGQYKRGGRNLALVFDRLELCLGNAFLLGLLAGHEALVEERLDLAVHPSHAELASGLAGA